MNADRMTLAQYSETARARQIARTAEAIGNSPDVYQSRFTVSLTHFLAWQWHHDAWSAN